MKRDRFDLVLSTANRTRNSANLADRTADVVGVRFGEQRRPDQVEDVFALLERDADTGDFVGRFAGDVFWEVGGS